MLSNLKLEYWVEQAFLTPQWWLLLIVLVTSWVVFFKLIDKKKKPEIYFYGLSIFTVTIFLDNLGTELVLWEYPIMVAPWGARLICVDATLPVFYMLVYQYFPRWVPFSFALLGLALILAFVLEPLTIWLNIYLPLHWKHIYSFPIYIAMGAILKYTTHRVFR